MAADLHAALTEGLALFAGVDEALSAERPQPGAWCAREIIGHLIDSACNNHRRWIVGQTPGRSKFDGYEQFGNDVSNSVTLPKKAPTP